MMEEDIKDVWSASIMWVHGRHIGVPRYYSAPYGDKSRMAVVCVAFRSPTKMNFTFGASVINLSMSSGSSNFYELAYSAPSKSS